MIQELAVTTWKVLEQIEWSGEDHTCPYCGGDGPNQWLVGIHEMDCELLKLMNRCREIADGGDE